MAAKGNARAAVLAIAMNVMPVAPVDFFRFLNVPAIVWVLKRRARFCREQHPSHQRRR